jgi:HlyD family secretion protein
MKRRTILYIVVGVVLVALVAGVIVLRPQLIQDTGQETRTAIVERGTLLVSVSASGGVEPQTTAELTFEMPGRVADVQVRVGDSVQSGDVLAQLDTRQMALQAQQARSALSITEAQLAQLKAEPRPEEIAAAEADLQAATAQVDGAAASLAQLRGGATDAQIAAAEAQVAQAELQHKLAQLDFDRVNSTSDDEDRIEQAAYDLRTAEKSLAAAQAGLEDVKAGANAEDVRAAEANVEAAQAQRDAAQSRLDLLLAGPTQEQLADAEAQVERAQATLAQAELALERATLRAPFDGTVARVDVSAGEMAPIGRPAITLLDDTSFQVAISVDELDVGRLEVGQAAHVTVEAFPETPIDGMVTSIAPAATLDQGGVVSYAVVVTLDRAKVPIRADMTANVTIVVEELTDVLLIPMWVVRVDRRTGQTYVDRQEGNEFKRFDITLGVRHEGVAQVLDGLSEGDEVVWVPEDQFDFGGQQ